MFKYASRGSKQLYSSNRLYYVCAVITLLLSAFSMYLEIVPHASQQISTISPIVGAGFGFAGLAVFGSMILLVFAAVTELLGLYLFAKGDARFKSLIYIVLGGLLCLGIGKLIQGPLSIALSFAGQMLCVICDLLSVLYLAEILSKAEKKEASQYFYKQKKPLIVLICIYLVVLFVCDVCKQTGFSTYINPMMILCSFLLALYYHKIMRLMERACIALGKVKYNPNENNPEN